MSEPVKVYAAIARAVAARATTLFGVVGEGNIHLVHDLVARHGIRYVKATREDAAVLMANAYASVRGEVGFATMTHGPGLTNAITALTQGARNRVPVVVLVGDTDPAVRDGRQRIEQAALVSPTGAGFEPVTSAATAVDDVARAVGRARAERRPVVLNMPVNVQEATVEYTPSSVRVPEPQAVAPDPEVLDQAVGVVATARRPVVIAGRGAVASGAKQTLLALAERIGAPVATTLLAKGLFRGEPFDLGICGTLSHGPAVETIMAADCLVVFGAALNADTTANGSLIAGKRIVHVDLDPEQLGRRSPVTVAVHGDADRTAAAMLEWLQEIDLPRTGTLHTEELATRLACYDPRQDFAPHDTDVVDSRLLTLYLDEVFPEDRTYVSDAGRFMLPGFAWMGVPDPSAFVQTVDFGSIGLGLGTAVGAAVARPDRPVLLAIGDGGLAMGLGELLTAVREGLDLTVVVYNDSAYGAEIMIADRTGMDPEIGRLAPTDFAALARGMGAAGITVACDDDLPLVEKALGDSHRPLVVDVKTDPRTPIPH